MVALTGRGAHAPRAEQTGAAAYDWKHDEDVWGTTELPEWDDDAPERLYGLFRRWRYTHCLMSNAERDAYSLLLMQFLAMRYRQFGFVDSLQRAKLDVQDAAQDTLMILMKRTRRLTLRTPHPKVLLEILQLTIYRYTCALASRSLRRHRNEVLGCDYVQEDREGQDRSLDNSPGSAVAPEVKLDDLLVRGEAFCVEGLPGRRKDLLAICRAQRRSLVATAQFVPYAALSKDLRSRTTPEQHALVTSRVRRIVCELAALASAAGGV